MESKLVEIPIVVPAYTCGGCGAPVISRFWQRVEHPGSMTERGVSRQLAAAGAKFSAGFFGGRTLCNECAGKELANFTCALCKTVRPSSQVHKTWGNLGSEEYVCTTCYATVPAQRYCEFVERMSEEHRYDFYP